MADLAVPKLAEEELLRMTTEVVAAYVSNNTLATSQLGEIIHAVYNSLRSLDGQPLEAPTESLKPAVPIRKSITPDYLVCLEDGKKLKMLKRHLRSTYGMTPDEYRTKWGLAAGLSDGRAQLCRAALRLRQEDRPRTRHRPPRRTGEEIASYPPACCSTAGVIHI